jgi:hypothetical protein
MTEPDWNNAPPFGRRDTLIATLKRLYALYPGPSTFVETGTARDENSRDGDGWSTVAFGWYCSETGGRCWTVDISPQSLAVSRRLTEPYAAAIEYVEGDSPRFLHDWDADVNGPIHLLYLDSLDYHDRDSSEAHSLAETREALPHLADTCLVLFDDMHVSGEPDGRGLPPLWGKGAQAVPWLVNEHEFQVEWCAGSQVLLSRDAKDGAGMEY